MENKTLKPAPLTQFDHIRELINKKYNAYKESLNAEHLIITRKEILEHLKAKGAKNGTIDHYRRLLTVTQYLGDRQNCPGVFDIKRNIPENLTTTILRDEYNFEVGVTE